MTQVNGFHSCVSLVNCISLGFFKLLEMLNFLAKKCYEMQCKYSELSVFFLNFPAVNLVLFNEAYKPSR